MKKSLTIFLFFLLGKSIYSVDPQHLFGLRAATDINTTLESRFINEGKYQLTLEENWQMSLGYMIGAGQTMISGYHIESGYDQLFTPELSFHLKFLNKAYHSFNISENSIIPWLTWTDKNFEIDLGINVRFLNFDPRFVHLVFFYPDEVIQPLLLYRAAGYYQFENPDIRVGLEIKNHDWSYASNTFAFSVHLDTIFQITNEWDIRFNVGVAPSGLSGLSLELNRYYITLGTQYRI